MARLQLSLLGTFRATLDGAPLTAFGYDKVRALLAYLAVESDRPHHRESLAGLLWPEQPERTARLNLSQALSRLRRILDDKHADPPFIDVTRQTLQFNPASDHWLDAVAFTRALEGCEKHAHAKLEGCGECLERLEGAAALYRGAFLVGFSIADSAPFEEWALLHRERLHRLAQETLGRLAHCYAASGEYEKALLHAWRQVELDPWREAAQRGLMRLLALSGQRGAALAQYEVCRRLLAEELGVEPAQETTALYEVIRDGALVEGVGRERKRVSPIPHNLPPQSTPFIGREEELVELSGLITNPDTRLVVILGPGGVGKTRLSLAVAEEQLRATISTNGEEAALFRDGVFFVPLARVSAAEHMAPAVAEGLGFRFVGGESGSRPPGEQVLDYLREKRLLLVLDNLEHLAEGFDLVADILHTAPGVQILGTSRERLRLYPEQAYPIGGLKYPDWEKPPDGHPVDGDYPAGRLFVQAARRVQPVFEIAGEDVATLTRICRLLEGLPLGIELAASWANALSLADIAAEIQRGLDFLATEWRDVPTRHRSVRAVVDVSWNRLDEQERDAFAQLSVFRGGFTREAAREVAGADLPTLARLVDRSLLKLGTTRERYEVHELLRQYGAEKLGTEPQREAAARDRHSAFFCAALAQRGDAMNRGKEHKPSLDIPADLENVRQAWEMAARQKHVARVDGALDGLSHFFWTCHRHQEAEALYQLAIDGLTEGSKPLTPDGQRVLAMALLYRCDFNTMQGRWELVRAGIEQSKTLLEDAALNECDTRRERAWLHTMIAYEAVPNWEKAKRHYEQALTLQRELGFQGQVAYRLVNIALTNLGLREHDQARENLDESLALFRTAGDQFGVLFALQFLGNLARAERDFAEARRRRREALSLARAQGNREGSANALQKLGELAFYQGDFQAAVHYLGECVALWRALGIRANMPYALATLSLAHWFRGKFDRAYAHLEESLAIAEEMETPWSLAFATAYRAWLDAAAGRYDAARSNATKAITAYQVGAWNLPFVVAHGVLGWVALAENDFAAAGQLLQDAITAAQGFSQADMVQEYTAWSLAALGGAAFGLGNRAEAKRHLLEALRLVTEARPFHPLLHLMPIIPMVLADEEDGLTEPGLKERAVELYAMTRSHPFVATARLFEDIAGKHIRAATASLPPDIVAAAQERGRALDWWETAETLLAELRGLGWGE
jgi:DNA-binding SARP family transcriptional activator/predicted ATPase